MNRSWRSQVEALAELGQVSPGNNPRSLVIGVDHGLDSGGRPAAVKIPDRLNPINYRTGCNIMFQSLQGLRGETRFRDKPGRGLENRVRWILRCKHRAVTDDVLHVGVRQTGKTSQDGRRSSVH